MPDAFKASRSRHKVAGGLVATYHGGRLQGQIAHRFLAETPLARPFGRALAVPDNSQTAPVPLTGTGALGHLTTSCADQSARPGVEDPVSRVFFANRTAHAINVAQRVGVGKPAITIIQPGAVGTVAIRGSNTFQLQLSYLNVEVLINGVVRQDGAGTAGATCLVYGTSLQLTS
jgi:hypothetical protein